MKKIFTLVSVAVMAMSVNAQEIWQATSLTFAEQEVEPGSKRMVLQDMTKSANTTASLKKVEAVYDLGGEQPTEDQVKADATATLSLDDYSFTGATANVTLTGVSTPNSGTLAHEIWKMNGGDNVKLNETNLGEECLVPFDGQYVVAGNGNPGLGVYEYFFIDSGKKTVGPRYYETYWTPGCGSAPLKGCYYKFSVKAAGTLIIGFFLNKNLASNPLYLVDATNNTLVSNDALTIQGFRQNCNFEMEQGGTTKLTSFGLNDDRLIVIPDGLGGGSNRPLYGYLTFDVEAKDYYLFSPKSQIGVYGFYFQSGGTGITNVKTTQAENAPIFNLAGQKVSKDYKGVKVQNGKKFM